MIIRESMHADIEAIRDMPMAHVPAASSDWLEQSNGARTVEIDGQVLAVFTIHLLWRGVAHCGLIVDSQKASQNALALVRAGRLLIPEAMNLYGLHRLQTYVSALRPDIIRFNELIGFKAESIKSMAAEDKSDLFEFVCLRGH